MHAREKGEQRKGTRATKPRTKQGVASSRARDARREGGTAGTGHTAGTTPHQSTGEGSTRGTREKRRHAPRHPPHRHHTHRTHPHPRPQHVAGEPRQPAQRADSRGGGRLTPDAPHNGGRHPPPGTPYRRPHGAQRRPARARAVGPVQGPHARTDRTRDTRGAEPWLPAPEDGQPGEGQRLTPDAPHNGGRPSPPGTAPHHPHGTQPPQGMQAKGAVFGPHTHTAAPTARGWRTPTARPVGGQSGEGERLTSDAPHNGPRHPPRGRPSATPTASNAGPQGRTLWGRCWVPRPHRPHPGHMGCGGLAAHPRRRAARGGTAPDTRRLSQQWQATTPGTAPHHPHGTQPPQGMQAKGTVLGPHTHTPAPTARGWRTPTARPVGGQSGEGERLTSDAPHNGGRHPPRGCPSATPAASNAGPQGRTLWGRCWVPTPAPTAPGTHGSRNPGRPPQRTGSQGRDSA